MGNHYHLMVESIRGNLSAAMRMLSQEYTQFVNRSPGWEGPVFRGRFKNQVVYDEAHWHYLPIYLHMNPVRARMVAHAGQYFWSSHDEFCGYGKPPIWLSPDDLLNGYGGHSGYLELFEEVQQGRSQAPDEFRCALFEHSGAGVGKKKPKLATPKAFRTPTAALQEVSELTSVPVKQLKASVIGRRGNAPRALALWWLVYGAGLGTAEAGRKLGMKPSTASQSLSKWGRNTACYQNDELWNWRKELETRKGE
jgi:hypothetical protein